MDISQPLAKLLHQKQISRSKLARALGVHTTTVSNWLDGKSPKAEKIVSLAAYFDVPLEYFTEKKGTKTAPSTQVESAERLKLIKFIDNLPDELNSDAYNILAAAFRGRLNNPK